MHLKVLQNSIVQNALAMFAVQFARYLLPLATIPYLARVLGPEVWGGILFAQAFSVWLSILIDYGFNLSATREVARQQADLAKIADITSGVLGAKLLLVTVAGIITWVAHGLLGHKPYVDFLWLAWLLAVGTGLLPIWYFQGIERLRIVAILDFAARLGSTVGIFIFIHRPQDAWKVLLLNALASLAAASIGFVLMYRAVPFQLPSLESTRAVLKAGLGLFLSNVVGSFYTAANPFFLGLFSSASAVSYYGSVERLVRAALTLMQPVTQVLFPRISALISTRPEEAYRTVRLSLAVMTIASVTLAILLIIFAPTIVYTVLGDQFEPAIPVLRVLSLLIPLIAWGQVLGVQWLIPHGWDNVYVFLGLIASVVNVSLAIVLAPQYGALGMAWSVVIAEIIVVIGLIVSLQGRGKNPLWKTRK